MCFTVLDLEWSSQLCFTITELERGSLVREQGEAYLIKEFG